MDFNSPPLGYALGEVNPVHNFASHFCKRNKKNPF
jgi:hypothetical protein